MRRLWYELALTPLPLVALAVGLLAGLWVVPPVLYAAGASGPLAARFLDAVSFVVGAMLGAQLLVPELRGRTQEVAGARTAGLASVLLWRAGAVLAAWLVSSLWLASLLLWADAGRTASLLALALFVSGAAGFAVALVALAWTGSSTLAMSAASLMLGAALVARAAGLGLGPLEPFPLYAFYPDERLVASKLLWLLIAAVLVPLAAFMVFRPRWLLGDA